MINDFKRLLNNKQTVSITRHDKLPYSSIVWKKQKDLFGWVTQKEGFYEVVIFTDDIGPFTKERVIERNEHVVVEGTEVFYKPHLDFKMSTGATHTKFFNSTKELSQYISENEQLLSNFIAV